MNQTVAPMAGRLLAERIARAALEHKAEGISIYHVEHVEGASTVCDWCVICSGTPAVHVRAIAEGVLASLRAAGTRPWYHEGAADGRWVVIDYADVVAHVMLPQVREYYGLEGLWAAGTRLDVDDAGVVSHAAPPRPSAARRPQRAAAAPRTKRRSTTPRLSGC